MLALSLVIILKTSTLRPSVFLFYKMRIIISLLYPHRVDVETIEMTDVKKLCKS